jgi:hypothetical protein
MSVMRRMRRLWLYGSVGVLVGEAGLSKFVCDSHALQCQNAPRGSAHLGLQPRIACTSCSDGWRDGCFKAIGKSNKLRGRWPKTRMNTLALRGGETGINSAGGSGQGPSCQIGEEETREATRFFVVPSSQCPTLQDALDMMCQGDQCQVGHGTHSFGLPGPYPVQKRSVSMRGDEGSWILGRWYSEESSCNMTGLSFYADPASDTEDDLRMLGRVIEVVAGSWSMSACSVQCIDGIPVRVRFLSEIINHDKRRFTRVPSSPEKTHCHA